MLDTKRIRDLRGTEALSRILPIKVQVVPEVVRHYGVWHPDRSWLIRPSGELIVTTNRAVAEAQRDAVAYTMRGLSSVDPSLYEVRCIEEWAEEMR